MKSTIIITALFLSVLNFVFSQAEHQWSINTMPIGTLPLGSSSDQFKYGSGAELSASFIPGFSGIFGLNGGSRFLSLPLNSPTADHAVWTLSGFAGPFIRMPLNERLSISVCGNAGYYYWGSRGWDAINAGGDFYIGGNAGVRFRIFGPFTMGAGISYDYYAKLYNGLTAGLSVHLDYPALQKEREDVEIHEIELLPLFPVLYSYYNNHPIGTAKIHNKGKTTVHGINVRVYVERYMDNPMEVGNIPILHPGEEKKVELYALFTEDLLDVTEGTKASAKITVSYSGRKREFARDYTEVLDFYNRNAMIWNDDRKIASFVTAKDPEIMNFAKNISTWMQAVKNPALDENLQKGIALFEAIKSYGIRYEVDPTTPFASLSENDQAVDFLQFPRQTLQYTNGDCDDLTALYASLLEALGVESAFITIPGHIFAAFALKSQPEEIRKTISNAGDLIFINGKAWLPVEITMFQESFEKAWQTGAKEWREQDAKDQACFYPTREAWSTFQAVGFKEQDSGIGLPNKTDVIKRVQESLTRYVEREISPQIERLRLKVKESQGAAKYRNNLAVIYASYGLYDDALQELEAILSNEEYTPALINIGNIHLIQGDYSLALNYYNRFLDVSPENCTALLGVARCNFEMENYGLVKKCFEQVKQKSPDIAGRFAYLDMTGDKTSRASMAAEMKSAVIWETEEK